MDGLLNEGLAKSRGSRPLLSLTYHTFYIASREIEWSNWTLE